MTTMHKRRFNVYFALAAAVAGGFIVGSSITQGQKNIPEPPAVLAVPTPQKIDPIALAPTIVEKYDMSVEPKLVQAIVIQESNAGKHPNFRVAGHKEGLKPFQRYYGLGQIKLSAAKDVVKKHPRILVDFDIKSKTEDEIVANLIKNDEFNLTVTALYLSLLKDTYGLKSTLAIATAYNLGPTGAKSVDPSEHPYSRSVVRHMARL